MARQSGAAANGVGAPDMRRVASLEAQLADANTRIRDATTQAKTYTDRIVELQNQARQQKANQGAQTSDAPQFYREVLTGLRDLSKGDTVLDLRLPYGNEPSPTNSQRVLAALRNVVEHVLHAPPAAALEDPRLQQLEIELSDQERRVRELEADIDQRELVHEERRSQMEQLNADLTEAKRDLARARTAAANELASEHSYGIATPPRSGSAMSNGLAEHQIGDLKAQLMRKDAAIKRLGEKLQDLNNQLRQAQEENRASALRWAMAEPRSAAHHRRRGRPVRLRLLIALASALCSPPCTSFLPVHGLVHGVAESARAGPMTPRARGPPDLDLVAPCAQLRRLPISA